VCVCVRARARARACAWMCSRENMQRPDMLDHSPWVKRPERKADHSPQSSAECMELYLQCPHMHSWPAQGIIMPLSSICRTAKYDSPKPTVTSSLFLRHAILTMLDVVYWTRCCVGRCFIRVCAGVHNEK